MADQLDELTNEQLRRRMLEHGMPNMPVTSSTRKVLIKRLRTAESGSPAGAATNKSRRETIHNVARFSSGDESEAADPSAPVPQPTTPSRKSKAPSTERSSRRATIGVPSSATAAAAPVAEPPQPRPITTRRSSGRITPSQPEPIVAATARAPAPVARAPAIRTLHEDSDDDDDIQFVPVPASQQQPRSPSRLRQSRSPSLAKSQTVITSFQQVKEQVAAALAPLESDSEADEGQQQLETSGEAEVRSFTGSSRRTTATLNTTTTYSSDYQPQASAAAASWRQPLLPSTPPRISTNAGGGVLADDLVVTDANTPYLSDFTRRLSRLRAEPLTPSAVGRRRESVDEWGGAGGDSAAAATYRTSSARVHGRPSTSQAQAAAAGGAGQTAALWRAFGGFEQRYRLQIWSVVVVLAALFVYAMVFT